MEHSITSSVKEMCEIEKDVMKHALNKRIVTDYTKDGEMVFRRGNKKEAESVILDAFDNLSRHLVDNAHNTRALEYILKTHGIKIGKAEYQIALTETMDK